MERETKEAVQRLHRLRGILSTAVSTNSALLLQLIESSQSVISDEVKSLSAGVQGHIHREELRKVASWLCLTPAWTADESLETALRSRHPGTGAWLFTSPHFQSWFSNKDQHLWITGYPGSGKTILCSTIIEHLKCSYNIPSKGLLYFFSDYRDQYKKTLKGFLMTAARQLAKQSDNCFAQARLLYEEKTKDSERSLNTSEYLLLVKSFLLNFDEVVIVIDALDEASERDDIMNFLKDILCVPLQPSSVNMHPSVKLLLTSRLYVDIQRVLLRLQPLRLNLGDYIDQDVGLYVRTDIGTRISSGVLKLRDKNLATQIETDIMHRAGTFLQAKLQLDMITSLKTDRAIRSALQTLPNGLQATYETILLRIAARYPTLMGDIKTMLQCLVASITPVTTSQLAELVAINSEDKYLDFSGVSTDVDDVAEPLSNFVVLHQYGEDTVVEFCHYSVKEYLVSDAISLGPAKDFYINLEEAHTKLSEVCLQYVSFSNFDIPLSNMTEEHIKREMENYALLEYATLNWATHLNCRVPKSLEEFRKRIEPRLGWFLYADAQPNLFNHWQKVMRIAIPHHKARTHSPLCFAIRAGVSEVIDILLPKLSDINYQFPNGFTCLTAAACGNHVSIARRLLELGAQVDLPTSDRHLTPLHLAAENACEEMVELLLDAGASPSSRSKTKTTPFYRAARGGSIRILMLLYDRGSKVNALTWDRYTPLIEAVENGHEAAVRLLLSWGADPNRPTMYGSTAFTLARDLGRDSIQLILEEESLELAGDNAVSQLSVSEDEECLYDSSDSDVATVFMDY